MKKKNTTITFFTKNRTQLLFFAFLFVLLFALRDSVADIITKYWVRPVMSKMCCERAWLYSLMVSAVLGGYYFLSLKTERHRSLTRRNILFVILGFTGLAFLYSFFQSVKVWEFSPWVLLVIAVPLVGEYMLYIKLKRLKEQKDNAQALILEKPLDCLDDDSYKRENYAKTLAEKISNNFHNEGAFVTGISGNWGYGKTSFLYLINENIPENSIDVIIDFKPWLSPTPEVIVSDFLTRLSEKLAIHIPKLDVKLKRYAEALTMLESAPQVRDVIKLFRTGMSDSLEKHYEEISEILLESKLRVLVFIDDTDRLTAEEILEVFKLVRNSANFPYVQFVITYDREYVIETLEVTNPEKYLEKIFNLEVSLPAFASIVVQDALSEELENRLKIGEWHMGQIQSFIKSGDGFPLDRLIRNKRDLVRFVNSLIVNIEALKKSIPNFSLDDINIVDFVKIELVRFKYPVFYNKLLNDPLSVLETTDDKGEYFTYKVEEPNNKTKTDKPINRIPTPEPEETDKNRYIKEGELLDQCMLNLFPKSYSFKKDSISNTRSFDQYFRYSYDEKNISQSEVVRLLYEENSGVQREILESYYSVECKKKGEIRTMFRLLTWHFSEESWDEKNKTWPFYYKKILHLIYSSLESNNEDLKAEVVSASRRIFHFTRFPNIDIYIEVLKLWDAILTAGFLVDKNIMMDFLLESKLKTKLSTIEPEKDNEKIEDFLRNSVSIVQMSKMINTILITDAQVDGLTLSTAKLHEIQSLYFLRYAENKKIDDNLIYLFDASNRYAVNRGNVKRFRELIDVDVQGYIDRFIRYDANFLNSPLYWVVLFDDKPNQVDDYLSDPEKENIEGIKWARLVWEVYKSNNFREVQIDKLTEKKRKKEELLSLLENVYNAVLDIQQEVGKLIQTDSDVQVETIEKLRMYKLRLNNFILFTNLSRQIIVKIDNFLVKSNFSS